MLEAESNVLQKEWVTNILFNKLQHFLAVNDLNNTLTSYLVLLDGRPYELYQ